MSLAALSAHAQASTNARPSLAGTNSLPADDSIPRSVFIVPRTPEEGRDPFFPTSLRLFGAGNAATNRVAKPVSSGLDLRLKGISGQANRRLALINNHTFEVGEEADIMAGERRLRIRCLQISDTSVVIQFGDERRELRLRTGL